MIAILNPSALPHMVICDTQQNFNYHGVLLDVLMSVWESKNHEPVIYCNTHAKVWVKI